MICSEEERKKWIEWEINSKDYLIGKVLERKVYPLSAGHSHCPFCWRKFGRGSDDLKEGYYESEKDFWICDNCFNTFIEFFHWSVKNKNRGE